MRQGYGGGKGPPPYLVLHPRLPRLKSRPLQIGFYITEAVRYEQLIFHSLFLLFLFFRSPSLPLSFLLLCSVLLCRVGLDLCFSISFFLFFPCSPSKRAFSPFRSACLGDLCFSHLPAWLNPPVCVVEHIAVIRMITIWPPPPLPSSWCWISIHHQLFASVALCLVYWSGLTDHIYPITHL